MIRAMMTQKNVVSVEEIMAMVQELGVRRVACERVRV